MEVGKYGDRCTVTALVTRSSVPSLCAHLHYLLGSDVGRRDSDVLLPADTRSFGLVAGAAGTPAQGVIENLRESAFSSVWRMQEEFWVIPISRLGTYFGWSDRRGVRVQFHTHTGEHYAVTVTYDVSPGHDEAREFFPLIEALLLKGTDSVAMNLTEKAAEQWRPRLPLRRRILYAIAQYLELVGPRLHFDDVQLEDPPPRVRIIYTGTDAAPEKRNWRVGALAGMSWKKASR